MTAPRRSSPDDELQRVLDELRVEYGASLPAAIDELTAAFRAAQAQPSEAAWMGARSLAHRLRGTAGSYGFPTVSVVSGRLEDALEELLSAEEGRREGAERRVERALGELLAASPAAVSAHPPGKGSAPPASGEPPPSSAGSGAPATRPRQPAQVLVVDDDPAFLLHVEALARQQVFLVRTARTADAAIATARAERLDAALIDVHLDASSSFELARRLRTIHPGLSLAFISADGKVTTRVAAAHAGASVFLSKPLGAYELTTAMRRLLTERATTRPRVLVVDDDPALGALVEAILQPEMDVTTETDPKRVLDALDRVRPDLVLVDVHMPGVGGVDVCRMMRVTPRWQSLPILVVTQDPSLETRMAAFEAGADDYLLKPIVPQELSSRVRVRIERARLLYEMTNLDPLDPLPPLPPRLPRRPSPRGCRTPSAATSRSPSRSSTWTTSSA